MEILNFNPGIIKTTRSQYSFDGAKIDVFEDNEPFSFDGNIEIAFSEDEIDLVYVNLLFIYDNNGRKCSLSDNLKKEVVSELESFLYKINPEIA